MRFSLAEQWTSWWLALRADESSSSSTTTLSTLPLRFVERHVKRALENEGLQVPSSRQVQTWLERDLEPLVEIVCPLSGKPQKQCTLMHMLNMLWQPILEYIECIIVGGTASWTSSLAMHQDVVILEMQGVISEPEETLPIDDWMQFVHETLRRLLDVTVPVELVRQVLSPIVPVYLNTTRANVFSILRTSACSSKLVGRTLGTQLSRLILSEIAEVPVPLLDTSAVLVGLKQEVVDTLQQLHGPRIASGDDCTQPAKKAKRDKESLQEQMGAKTRQCLWILENRMAITRASQTLKSAQDLIATFQRPTSANTEKYDLNEVLVTPARIGDHMLLLDGALDRRTSEILYQKREEGSLAGVALATDESPPKQPRFRGLRFQITVMYLGFIPPVHVWESRTSPPIDITSMLGDIMHCAGKKGRDVSRVLEKQLNRVGLNVYDVVAGTGDGGGENEGSFGIHQHFENLSPGYVRHRCLPHIAWRTADMAIRSSGLDYKALCVYFVDGITWTRLREIATRGPDDGGLGLFGDGSRGCQEIFKQSPSTIIASRPETDLNFLNLLRGKEHVLHRLALKDLEQRQLVAETVRAVSDLGDIKQRVKRAVLGEILTRCMFLLYWNGKHNKVASAMSWADLLSKATGIILNLEVTNESLQRFGSTWGEFDGLNPKPKTWVEFAVMKVVGDQDLVEIHLREALDFHRTVTDSAASHLALVGDNTFRTPWLAAKLLSTDKSLARAAAQDLARHLASTRPGNRTLFEAHVFGCETLWRDLVAFSETNPPVLLWHGKGKFQNLFRFLAPRFLLAPDHVLDCERVHARWQWLCLLKRALKVHSLNACLRLTHYLEHNPFPSNEDLQPHLQAEAHEHRVNLQAMMAEGEIATGWRREFLYRERLGLSPQEANLIAADAVGYIAPHAMVGSPFAIAWRNYVKSVLRKGFMYKISQRPETILYVSENKTLAGKEDKTNEGEASGR